MSKNYTKFRDYYLRGLWDKNRLCNVVGKSGGITAEEYKLITGEDYDNA